MSRVGCDQVLKHGWTLSRLHEVAKVSVLTDRGHHGGSWADRLDIAWGGVVEALYAAEHPPSQFELSTAGRRALSESVHADWSYRGWSRHSDGPMKAFWRYWWITGARPTPSPEGGIVDRMSLRQVWRTLPGLDREALLALAAWDDYDLAARALGCSYKTFHQRVRTARRRFFAVLLDGETPASMGRDRRTGRKGEAPSTSAPATRKLHRRRLRAERAGAGS